MDAITSAFSSLANSGDNGGGLTGFLKGIAPYAGLGTAGLGVIGNIQANSARNQVLSAELARMNAYNKLTPAQVTSGITSLEQPLDQNLIKNVGNAVSGQLAERGLSQAPGIQTQALAQGLAPYQLQEQQLAQQAFFQKLGLPISAQPSPFGPYPATTNLSQLFQALSRGFLNPTSQPNQLPTTLPAGSNEVASILSSIYGPSTTASGVDTSSLVNQFLGNSDLSAQGVQ